MGIVIFNTFNLYFMFYFFLLATIMLLQHQRIKYEINKNKKINDDNYVTDNDLFLISGLFAFLSLYFSYNFYHMTFFGYTP